MIIYPEPITMRSIRVDANSLTGECFVVYRDARGRPGRLQVRQQPGHPSSQGSVPSFTHPSGIEIWVDEDGKLHREDGPAYVTGEGISSWWNRGQYHRVDGPAFISHQREEWRVHGDLHRVGGPAITYFDGSGPDEWWIEGLLYQEDPFS